MNKNMVDYNTENVTIEKTERDDKSKVARVKNYAEAIVNATKEDE